MKTNGGSAFPPALAVTPTEVVIGSNYKGGGGMSLRDWFAGRALPSLISVFGLGSEEASKQAYAYADDMLKEREK